MGKSPRKYKWEIKSKNKIDTIKQIFNQILYIVSQTNNTSILKTNTIVKQKDENIKTQ